MKESISKGMDDFLTWLGDSINESDRPDLEDFQDYVTYKKLSIPSPSESQSVVDNEFKKEILKTIISNAKAELSEDNYWTFRGMLVEFSKTI